MAQDKVKLIADAIYAAVAMDVRERDRHLPRMLFYMGIPVPEAFIFQLVAYFHYNNLVFDDSTINLVKQRLAK